MGRFSETLEKSVADTKRPPVLPAGHYVFAIAKMPEIRETTSKKDGTTYEIVGFQLKVVAPHDDVDPDELSEYGNPINQPARLEFMFSNGDEARFAQTEYRLKQFLENCGLDTSVSYKQAMSESVGAQFLGQIAHRMDPENPEVVYAEVKRTAKL